MKNKKGFTLIELMIVVSIIIIMTSVLLTSLSSLRTNAKLKTAQAEVASLIKSVQNYSLQGKIIPGVTVCGYGIRFTSPQSYQVYYNEFIPSATNTSCEIQNSDSTYRQHENTSTFSFLVPGETYSLPSGVVLNTPGFEAAEIFFTIPHANAYDYTGNNFGSLAITTDWILNISTIQKTITINSRGLISEN